MTSPIDSIDFIDAIDVVERAVRTLGGAPVVLAVSGGLDSMVLLDAAARVHGAGPLVVGTFDHGTGEAARRAARLVARRARSLGLPVERGRAAAGLVGEAQWRRARWAFLRAVADRHAARVATAHTRDDQVETVCMRALRGAGARGLAALAAPSPVLRPFLDLGRADLAAYAAARGVRWAEDPSNGSRAHLRNRLRHELLPAIRRLRPGFDAEMLDLARRAAAWRREVEGIVDTLPLEPAGAGLDVVRDSLASYDAGALAVLWPAVAARAGVTLDGRGTRRLAAFTIHAGVGDVMQLSGGWEVVRLRDRFALRPADRTGGAEGERTFAPGDEVAMGAWRLRPSPAEAVRAGAWGASLPADRPLRVRAWRPGDRMRAAGARAARRVKRFLSDAHVVGPDRAGWPVVLADEEIVWIPGIRRSDAATDRSGRPGVPYVCERNDR
jgi:tRNA(Ile)-lysidine synthase